jgi:hypothetical protein
MTSYTNIGGGLGILFVVFTSAGSSLFVTSFVSNSYLLLVGTAGSEELLFWKTLVDFLHLIPLTNCQSTMFVFSVMSFSCSSSVVGFIWSNWYLASHVGSSRGEWPILLVAFFQGMEASWQGDLSIVVEGGCSPGTRELFPGSRLTSGCFAVKLLHCSLQSM